LWPQCGQTLYTSYYQGTRATTPSIYPASTPLAVYVHCVSTTSPTQCQTEKSRSAINDCYQPKILCLSSWMALEWPATCLIAVRTYRRSIRGYNRYRIVTCIQRIREQYVLCGHMDVTFTSYVKETSKGLFNVSRKTDSYSHTSCTHPGQAASAVDNEHDYQSMCRYTQTLDFISQ
jgi:hypothetical protein